MRIKYLFFFSLYICIFIISCNSEPYPGGKRVYSYACENCHMADGSGLPPLYPSLLDSYYFDSKISELPCLILKGKQSQIVTNVAMPGNKLSDIEISNLINYMNVKWGTKKEVAFNEIKEFTENCQKD